MQLFRPTLAALVLAAGPLSAQISDPDGAAPEAIPDEDLAARYYGFPDGAAPYPILPEADQGPATGLPAALRADSLQDDEVLIWDLRTNRVTARFDDWPLEKALVKICHAARWEIWIPEGTTLTLTAQFRDLPVAQALRRLFGHLNYSLVRPKGSSLPRLKVHVPGFGPREGDPDDAEEEEEGKSSYVLLSPFHRSSREPTEMLEEAPGKVDFGIRSLTPEERQEYSRRFLEKYDTDGDGKLSEEEKAAFRKGF